ncbi:hypothetical protein BH11PAT4_BH11PAT4_1580 [soil metagenome]
MQTPHSQLSAVGIIAIVLAVAGVFWVVLEGIPGSDVATGPVAEQKVVAQQSSTKAALVTADEPVSLEQSAQVFVANFYAAYADADAGRIATYFTVDRKGGDLTTYQQLFFGDETTKLFVAPSASEKVSGHEVIAAEKLRVGWRLTVSEQRSDADGNDLPGVTTILTLVPAPVESGSWLIASYARDGKDGTYEALTTNP